MRLSGFAALPWLPAPLRWPARILIGLAQGYAIAVAILFVFQRSFIYPTWGVPADTAPPLGVSRVEIATADGERLMGYWSRPIPGKPIILSFHGNAGSPLYHAERFSSTPWSSHGWGYLAIAYRGYPGSTGSPSETGLAADAEAALRYVREREGDVPVVLHGHSIGAAVAIGLAARHRVAALYLEAPFTSLRAAASSRFPWLPTSLVLDRFPSAERAPGIDAPVLIVHGEDDPVIPPSQGRDLAALFPHARFKAVPFADHASVFGSADPASEPILREAAGRATAEATASPRRLP